MGKSNEIHYVSRPDLLDEIDYGNDELILDKDGGRHTYIDYMLARTNRMFEYEGLPDTIPAYILELYLQAYGAVVVCEVQSTELVESRVKTAYGGEPGVYIFRPAVGGIPNIYYQGTTYIVANPILSRSLEKTPGKDAVLLRNDLRMKGLMPMFRRYAQQMVENDISLRSAQINARAQLLITADNDRDLAASQKYISDLVAGKFGSYGNKPFLEGINALNVKTQSVNTIMQLIELQQYLKASWFNEIGLNTNFNMKREYLSTEEIKASTDVLLPLIDDMYDCRRRGIDEINEMFGLNISVSKGSAWQNKQNEADIQLDGELEEAANDTTLPDGGGPGD